MKKEVSPVVAIVVVVIVIAIAAFAWMKLGGNVQGSKEGQQPPPIPASVQAEFQKRLGGMSGPGGGAAPAPQTPANSGR